MALSKTKLAMINNNNYTSATYISSTTSEINVYIYFIILHHIVLCCVILKYFIDDLIQPLNCNNLPKDDRIANWLTMAHLQWGLNVGLFQADKWIIIETMVHNKTWSSTIILSKSWKWHPQCTWRHSFILKSGEIHSVDKPLLLLSQWRPSVLSALWGPERTQRD